MLQSAYLRYGALFLPALLLACWVVAADPVDDESAKPARNPFVPRNNLSAEELFEYMERLAVAPRTVQNQDEYGPALFLCAERLIAMNPGETLRAYAARVKLDALHKVAQFDNAEYQERLVYLARESVKDSDKAVRRWAEFYLLENDCVTFEQQVPAAMGKLLDRAYEGLKSLSAEELDARFLRIASYLTRIINVLPEEERVAKEYKRFGELFAQSEFRELSRYGKKIAKGIPAKPQNLVGKPMPISGVTLEGEKFDIEKYKGKIVLVDFWATWCGPCRASMPELRSMHEDLHDQGFEIVGISLDQDADALKEYLEEEEFPWINLFDADDSEAGRTPMAEKYGVRAIPATYVLDRQGNVLAVGLRGKQLRAKIEAALDGKAEVKADDSKKPADKKEQDR